VGTDHRLSNLRQVGQVFHAFVATRNSADVLIASSEENTPDLERRLTTFFAAKVAPSDIEKPLYLGHYWPKYLVSPISISTEELSSLCFIQMCGLSGAM